MIREIANSYRKVTLSYWNTLARLQFAIRGVQWPERFTVKGKLGLSALGTIRLGTDITLVNDSKYNRAGINHPTQLVAGAGATLKIGNHVGISGASIFCVESISIGDHVLIGANSRIYDTDFHPLDFMARRNGELGASAPVVIEDDVWLAANVTVLKGVTIGARSVIAAGSVVTRDIPPDTLAAGSPAKPIRNLSPKKMKGPRPDCSPTIRKNSQPMRVLVFEPNPSGHRFQYAETVIRAVSEFTTDIVFATTEEATQTTAFREYIEPLLNLVQLDTSAVNPSASPLREAIRKTAAFHRAVKKYQPDQIYVPTADGFVQLLGISNLLGFRSVKQEMELEILLMGGQRYFQSNHWKLKLSRRLWIAALRASGATVIHVLDPWLREKIVSSSNSPDFSAKLQNIPEPVESINLTNLDEARHQLGISPQGRYLGFFGAVNRRKGADLLLRAFSESCLAPNDKLLLMGKIDEPIRDLLDEECAELLASGKIILFDRFVSQEELQLGLSAVDVVCAPYPHHPGSSGFVVRAASVNKYLLATNYGWIGDMTYRYELGRSCDVRNTLEFSKAISKSLEESEHFRKGGKSEDFTNYHTLANTQLHWTKRIRARIGKPAKIILGIEIS